MKQKTVLITGASRGIGKAAALRFADMGYRIIINSHKNGKLLSKTKQQIISEGVPCLSFIGDMGNYDTVLSFFKQIESFCDGVDILVNNAGISYIGLLSEMPSKDWDTIIRSNLYSAFYCCKHAIPYMVRQKEGKIINISSVWGAFGASCEVAYSASKGAVNAFTKALAKELAPSNIQVNAIACGLIDTDMNSSFTKDEMKEIFNDIPAGRAGTPEEVAALIYSLCEGNPYLTGQIIALDGGWI